MKYLISIQLIVIAGILMVMTIITPLDIVYHCDKTTISHDCGPKHPHPVN